MKRNTLNQIVIFVILISFTNFQSKKEKTDKFCGIHRTEYLTVNNKEGMIVFSNKYNRYAVSLTAKTANNIDSQVIGFKYGLSSELKSIGLKVIVSGTLKNFNKNENMTSEIAAQDLFFETTQIAKN
jgi:hypothetical protein